MKRIVFLDIDGVLNSRSTRPPDPRGLGDFIDAQNLILASELAVRSGAEFVVSSSWRRGRTAETLDATLRTRGFVGVVVDTTPEILGAPRWLEIRTWLDAHRGTEFVILDDESDMGELAKFHVRCSPLRGLTREELEPAIELLGGERIDPVRFFHPTKRPFGVLSNFSPHAVTLAAETWLTAEHHYQAQKFLPGAVRDSVKAAPSPHAAKVTARRNADAMRPEWEAIKEDVMRETLAAKFDAHAVPRAVLLATGNRVLVEASPHDDYWGAGAGGDGKNRLGHLLMELRGTLTR